MITERPSYFNNLDGLRAIAAFAVIFFHIDHWIGIPNPFLSLFFSFDSKGGRLGVQFFFILSGFLISYLLFSEQEKLGKINILFFYMRRMLRIWPVYFLTLFIGFVIYPMIAGAREEHASWALYSLFLANFDLLWNGSTSNGILGVQWSVAIEEQFYLLWPLIFFTLNRKTFFSFLLIMFVALSEWFYFKTQSTDVGKYHFISSFRFLAFGCLMAWFCFNKLEFVTSVLHKINKPLTVFIYVICIPLMFFNHHIPNLLFNEFIPFFFFGFVIIEQNFSQNSFFKIGNLQSLTWLGKISYGLYLYHMVAIYIVIGLFPVKYEYVFLKGCSVVLLTVLISHLSYRYFEKYFLSLKEKHFTLKAVSK